LELVTDLRNKEVTSRQKSARSVGHSKKSRKFSVNHTILASILSKITYECYPNVRI